MRMACCCSIMSGTSVWGTHERLGGLEQLDWNIHILDSFFTHVSGTLADTVEVLASTGTLGQSHLYGPLLHGGQCDRTFEVAWCFDKQDRSCLPFMTQPLKLYSITLPFTLFFFFFGFVCSLQKFPSQGSNPYCWCNQSHSSDTKSLIQ